jgi:hypothetical protein
MGQLRGAAQFQAELGALEQSVDRARSALACVFSGADEFEAAVIRAQRARGAFRPRHVTHLRLILAATVAAAILALGAMVS